MKFYKYLIALQISLLSASVEHKEEFINVYLSNISDNMDEKTQILPYIQKNQNGTFLDIGTGGDAIGLIAKQLNPLLNIKLIAADIDSTVIESICKRQKDIEPFLHSKKGLKVDLVTMSAVDMKPIKDSSLAGISASALAHEIFSYVPSMSSLDRFANEICRTLEKDGIFIYRDPKWVSDPMKICTLTIKNETAKYYSSLFISKFLDRDFSQIKDYKNECAKPSLYNPKNIFVHVFLKDTDESKILRFDEFLQIPSRKIDYQKNFAIQAPAGFIAEIQRHYLMYIKDYFCPGLIDPQVFTNEVHLDTLSSTEKSLLEEFANKKSLPIVNNTIQKKDIPLYLESKINLQSLFNNNFTIPVDNTNLEQAIQRVDNELNKNLFYFDSNHNLHIDPKMMVLLFQGKEKTLFPYFKTNEKTPWDLLEHLKLEGEEHYFYKTQDELLVYFAQISEFLLKESHKQGYILAPISPEMIIEAPREFYKNILQRDFLIIDSHGVTQDPVSEKNIIHFKLQKKSEAIEVFKELVKSNPNKYVKLEKWLQDDFKRNS